MFEKRVEMNKIRYGGIRGGKLVIMRAKVIAWSHVMLCKGTGGRGGGLSIVMYSRNSLSDIEAALRYVMANQRQPILSF